VCTVRFAVYTSCLTPTEMFKDANKLCLDELCRANNSFSGGFLGNKDDPLNAKLISSECHLSQ